MEVELIRQIKKDLAIDLPVNILLNELERLLTVHINDLVKNNFQQLITLLYRVDIDESRLRQLLQQHMDETAGMIIAKLIIERQLQKIESRRQINQTNNNISEDEKW